MQQEQQEQPQANADDVIAGYRHRLDQVTYDATVAAGIVAGLKRQIAERDKRIAELEGNAG